MCALRRHVTIHHWHETQVADAGRVVVAVVGVGVGVGGHTVDGSDAVRGHVAVVLAVHAVVVPYEVAVAHEGASADAALVARAAGVRADVQRELRLGRERHGAPLTVQRLVGHVRPPMCCYVTLHGKTFLANITCVWTFPCVRSFVYVEGRLLRESLEADVALVGALAGVRAVVDLEVLLAGEGGGALQALEGPALH